MKNLMVFGAGGLAFMMAAMMSGAVYWFAPINPCYVSVSDEYGFNLGPSQYETLCSGSDIHSDHYGLREVDSRNGDADFFVKLILIMFPFGTGAFTLLITNALVSRIITNRRKAAAAQAQMQVQARPAT